MKAERIEYPIDNLSGVTLAPAHLRHSNLVEHLLMKVIWNKQYRGQFSTYDEKWRRKLSSDAKTYISNWPPESGKFRLDIRVFYKPGNVGLQNTDVDNVAKIVIDGIFGTKQPGTGPDRFIYELSVVKARSSSDGLDITLFDLQDQ